MSAELLQKACSYYSQRKVGDMIGKSGSTVNLLLKGKYPNPEKILLHVQEVFAHLAEDRCECPTLGVLHVDVCEKYRSWAKQNKVHKDRLYMKVKNHCINCMRNK
jgi:hypothetical protein